VVATSVGFYAQAADYGQSSTSGLADYFSADGRTWSAVQDGPSGYQAQIVDVEGGILAVDADPSSGAMRVFTGRVAQGELTWIRESASEGPFAGVAFARLASDGQRALLVGSNRSTNAPVAWVGSAGAWAPLVLPARALGGTPTQAIGGPAGFVVAGYRWTLRGENPILWHQVAGGWAPEQMPLLRAVPDPGLADCNQSRPADANAFMVLDRALAAVCFGDAPISFRAYVVPCDGCAGEVGDLFVPEWLASPTEATLFLAPFVTANGYYTSARLAPTVGWNKAWPRHWLQVTGHFDDPASRTCRWYPDPTGGGFVAIPHSTIDQCRQEFVVTAVRVVSGP
jgi:hypothetical protein